MRISKRLEALYEAVNPGESVADIGTDHGYVPILLLQNGISEKVILSDISTGSLAKAEENFRQMGIEIPETCFRIGDGLSSIEPGEVDALIIGGLGGRTIRQILADDPEKTATYRKLIVQPRNNSGELRYYLYQQGYDIRREILAPEGKFVCEVIVAVKTTEVKRTPPYDAQDIRWKYPESMISCNPELLGQRIGWLSGRLLEQVESLRKSKDVPQERIRKLLEQRDYILELEKRNKKYHEEHYGEKTQCN